MPPAVIAAIIGAGVTATDIGLQASGAFQPSTSGQVAAQEQSQEAQQKAAEQQAFKHFAPDVQSQTGGSLSDTSFASLVAELAGQPGDIGLSQQTIFGNTNNPGSGLPETPSGLASGGTTP